MENLMDDPSKSARWAGRPPVHTEQWSKVTVVLLNRQIVFLDRLSADMRATTGAVVKRAEIIRALIDSLAESSLDLKSAQSETDLKKLLRGSAADSASEPVLTR
jgi:hypothetical protein